MGGVLRRSTHGPARRSQAPRRATRGPWPRLRYRLNHSRPFASAPTVADRFRQAGGQCRFIGTVAPAGTLAQGSRARPPPSSRPARSGALADLRGCHGTVGTGPLRSQRLRVALLPGLLPGRTGSDSFVESLAAIRPRSLGWGARLRRPPRRRRGSAPPRSGRPAPWWCGLLVALPLPEPRRGPRLPPGVYRNCYARTNSHQGG